MPPTTLLTLTYTARGPIRGACGHTHRTLDAAEACADRDARACAAHGGYSDRRAVPLAASIDAVLTARGWTAPTGYGAAYMESYVGAERMVDGVRYGVRWNVDTGEARVICAAAYGVDVDVVDHTTLLDAVWAAERSASHLAVVKAQLAEAADLTPPAAWSRYVGAMDVRAFASCYGTSTLDYLRRARSAEDLYPEARATVAALLDTYISDRSTSTVAV